MLVAFSFVSQIRIEYSQDEMHISIKQPRISISVFMVLFIWFFVNFHINGDFPGCESVHAGSCPFPRLFLCSDSHSDFQPAGSPTRSTGRMSMVLRFWTCNWHPPRVRPWPLTWWFSGTAAFRANWFLIELFYSNKRAGEFFHFGGHLGTEYGLDCRVFETLSLEAHVGFDRSIRMLTYPHLSVDRPVPLRPEMTALMVPSGIVLA